MIFRAVALMVLVLMALMPSACYRGRLTAAQSPPAFPHGNTYPNRATGLEQLMGDMIALRKTDDSVLLAPYLQRLVLPNFDRWFSSEFGDAGCEEESPGANECMGPRLAFSYESLAKDIPPSFALTLQDLIHEGLTSFEATNITEECSGPIRIVPNEKLLDGLTTTPMVSPSLPGPVNRHEPVYALWIYGKDKQTTLSFFVYSEGAFRYLGMLSPASFDDLRKEKSTAPGRSTLAPAARYLTEDQLEVKDAVVDPSIVQRTVVLHVVTAADGTPKEVTYVRGPEAYRETAIESTKKRRFELPPLIQSLQALQPTKASVSFCVNFPAPL